MFRYGSCSYFKRLQMTVMILVIGGALMNIFLGVGNCFDTSTQESSKLGGGTPAIKATDNESVIQTVCFRPISSPKLEQFVDSLPIIPRIAVSNGSQLVMKAYKISRKLHRDLPKTTLYAFGTSQSTAQIPGPALVARRNVPTYIRWENHIKDEQHFLPVDLTVTTAIPPRGGVPIVPHLHGMETESKYDGHPEAWFTSKGDKGPAYVTKNYTYYNTLLPALVWYHDHTVGMTRVNVVAGLAGPYIVRGSDHEEPKGLPSGEQEIILVLEDRTLFANGSINFPSVGDDTSVHPNWCPAYFGDIIIVNGKVWPYLEVLPFKYRLRILNGASERYFRLSLDRANMTFVKIGTDGGYLLNPIILDEIILAPAERVDCIVDFGGLSNGTTVVVNNSAPAPFPGGSPIFPPFASDAGARAVLQFRVGATSQADPSRIPTTLTRDYDALSPGNDTKVRQFTLDQRINNVGDEIQVLLANRTWGDPVTEFPRLETTEIWEFIGLTRFIDHPIHIHLIKFQLLSVQLINITRYLKGNCSIKKSYGDPKSCFLGASRGPNAQEVGWKDVISAVESAVTRIAIRFTSQDGSRFNFDPTTSPGYLWHCHVLSHEDNSMMRPLHIKNSNSTR